MIIKYCIYCDRPVTIECTPEQFQAWREGTLIQKAMPNIPPEDREMLISGICGKCWKDLFKED